MDATRGEKPRAVFPAEIRSAGGQAGVQERISAWKAEQRAWGEMWAGSTGEIPRGTAWVGAWLFTWYLLLSSAA